MKAKKLIALLVSFMMLVGLALAMMPTMEVYAQLTLNVDADLGTIETGDKCPNPRNGATYKHIQAAIDCAQAGDTIVLAAGTYSPSSGESFQITIDKNLTLRGAGEDVTFVDAGETNRVFFVDGVTVSIVDMTIQGGDSTEEEGGGIYNENGTVTMTNCTVRENDAHDMGGGIHNDDGTVTMSNCTVRDNSSDSVGGGIANWGGTVTMTNCTVRDNNAEDPGGGIFNEEEMTLNGVTVTNNRTRDKNGTRGHGGDGGGICNYDTMTLNNCTVSVNRTGKGSNEPGDAFDGGDGGGIYNGGTLTCNNSTISGNTTGRGGDGQSTGGDGGNGGGIYNNDTLTLNNCTITENTTGRGGTGSQVSDGADGDGGGIYDGVLNLSIHPKNTIIANNSATGLGPDCYGNLTSEGCNLVGDNSNCSISSDSDDQIGTGLDPIDPRLGLLRDNGGPTYTHALLDGSPALDGVSDDCECTTRAGETLTEDQRGAPRPIDGNEDGTALCDIGAYERQPAPAGVPGPEQEDDEVAVGGTVEPIDLPELDTPGSQQLSSESTHTSIALWIGLASGLAIVGCLLALRRRRVH